MFWALLLAAAWVWGAAPTIHWLDTSELALSAQSLGIGHPPGQVPYVLMSGLFQWLPAGDAGFRSTVSSVFFSTVSVWLVLAWFRKSFFQESRIISGFVALCGLSSVASLQAMRPEVYALACALTLGSVLTASLQENDRRMSMAAWFLWGLTAAVHPVISVTALPFLLGRGRFRDALFASFGALTLVYLPLRTGAAWNFGNPVAWDRFLWFIRGDLYQAYDHFIPERFLENAGRIVSLFSAALTSAGVLLAVLGVASVWRRNKADAVSVSAAVVFACLPLAAMMNFWPENPDAKGYLLPAFWLLAAAIGAGLGFLLQQLGKKTAAACSGLLLLAWGSYQAVNFAETAVLRRDWSAHRHMTALASEPPAGSSVSLASFSSASLLRYAQIVEGARPDLEIGYRGMPNMKNKREAPVNQLWELGIAEDGKGRYTVASEDLKRSKHLRPHGWFYAPDSAADAAWEGRLKERTARIQADGNGARFDDEPLLLNYLLHLVFARIRKDHASEIRLTADAKELFPAFGGYGELAEPK